jgi:hypothetical protein
VIVRLINDTDEPVTLQRRVEFRQSDRGPVACGEMTIKPGGHISGVIRKDSDETWTLFTPMDVVIDVPKRLFKEYIP